MTRCFLSARALTSSALAALLSACVVGCGGRTFVDVDLGLDAGADAGDLEPDAGPPPITKSDKVDLLLVVDNSRNLDLAHQLLAETVPYLLDRLIEPSCVNGLGNVVAKPAAPGAPCPLGTLDFAPVRDLHLAVISTSLGGHGADICSPSAVSYKSAQNDASHLLTRTEFGGLVPTYQNKGFLAWDPAKALAPPGESDALTLTAKLVDLVKGAGQEGCGFEAQLESIYRFLVDPTPYAAIPVIDGKAVPQGIDQTVIQQRADFVRPDSALVVVLLTDENDCSTREGGQYFLVNQGSSSGSPQPFHLPRPRSECAEDPLDPCCASCGQSAPSGCSPNQADPNCAAPTLTAEEDPINLRCFDQKRRFGIDFLYPIDRYVRGFTDATVADRDGNVVPNPLFTANRSPELVLFGGILGVPWQDVAKDPGALSTGFAPVSEIDWSVVIGDPDQGIPPTDPLMIESVTPRTGESPKIGAPLAPPSSPPMANPINGHERFVADADDLQYACIYPRPTPKACTAGACECSGEDVDTNPICQQPDGSYAEIQRAARALPSIRELRVIRELGDRAAVGSICAPVTVGQNQPTFAYKPAVDAILRALRSRLE